MACGSREGVSSCVVRCTMSGTPRRVYESREYVDEVLRCISESGCRIHDGQEVAGADCRERVASAVVPSPLVYMHCRRASVRYDDCGYVYPLEQCIEGTKLYDETVVRELDHCLEHKCGHVGRCVYSVVGEGEGRTRLKEK